MRNPSYGGGLLPPHPMHAQALLRGDLPLIALEETWRSKAFHGRETMKELRLCRAPPEHILSP